MQKLWRAEFIGLVSLVIVAIFGVLLTFLYGVFFVPGALTDVLNPSEPFAGLQLFVLVCIGGCLPVVVYGAPIFAIYATDTKFLFRYFIVLASLPGLVMLAFSIFPGHLLLLGGIAVALTMDRIGRKWPGMLVGEAT